ncbi:Glycosyltransferase-like kobito [Thalictrum thalictroides]|uniref:Glycosyltransferase-like kobito n=1 Tax=Thalictrum thalictroides TaxID=46969 RepID=A0A7J6X803_THATH|nr:Glycosyltransferase-like kobito [Thalictrum thalictroides]
MLCSTYKIILQYDAYFWCFLCVYGCLRCDADVFLTTSRYHEHIVWADKALNLKLMRKGILTRIYAPMVIVQGLRESGVFSSVVLSAQKTLSKDKFLTSVESSNSSRTVMPNVLSVRKFGRSKDSEATARRLFEIADTSHAIAVPPLSPPVMDELQMEV